MNAAGDPSDDVVRRIQTDISSWTPERGPRWAALQESVRERPRQLFRVYVVAGLVLVTILFGSYFAMAAMKLDFASQPVATQAHK